MEKKALEYRIQINNENYEQLHIVGISVNELLIRHTLSSTDGERFEELVGNAEFIDYASLEIVSSDGSRSLSQSKLNLSIRKANVDLKNAALLNLKKYLGDIENIEEYGFNECVYTGLSHLTYSENIYRYDKEIELTLVLADDVYEILLSQVKSQTISIIYFGINYFNLFRKVKTESNKELYEFGKEEKNIYIVAENNDVELFASTFGSIETFIVYSHKNLLNEHTEKVDEVVELNKIREYEQNVLNHITAIRAIIAIGLFVIILLLIINAFLIS